MNNFICYFELKQQILMPRIPKHTSSLEIFQIASPMNVLIKRF